MMQTSGAGLDCALKRLDTVVIGTSLEKGSDSVVEAGFELAHALHAAAYVVHAAPLEPLSPRFGAGWAESDYFREFTKLRWKEVRQQLERVPTPSDVRVKPLMRTDAPHLVVTGIAEEIGGDLIVVGASESTHGIGRLLGSTAERVLRKAPCPTLVLRRFSRLPWKRVLVPVDLSMLSADSFRCGLSFLSQAACGKCEIEALLVLTDLQRQALNDFTTGDRVESFALRELTHFVEENTSDSSRAVGTRLRSGEPRTEILAEAEAWGAELIVIGTHGRSGLERTLIGSVAAGVAARASSDVLVIPPETALGASIAEAVLEQTEPRWEIPESQPASAVKEVNS